MNNKKGFTFIEILVGVALIGLITVMLVPGIVDTFRSSKRNIMKVQEKQIADAAKIYLEDFCISPINNNVSCSLNYETDTKGFRVYNDSFDISTIVDLGYIESIKMNESSCEGYVVVENTTKVTTYLYCGDEYVTPGYSGMDEISIYDFTGYEENFYAPKAGVYSVELYGAQGAGKGGKGGKVYGEIYLNSGESLLVKVGGYNGYNGGGAGVYQGGGASTVKYNNKIIATAAGGGGGKEGTDGGNGNAAGGAYAEGTLDTAATGVAGSNGTDGGGGGAGNKYKDCTEYGDVYNSCLTGANTCVPGMTNGTCKTYSSCSSCSCATYNTCADAACGYTTCVNSACGCQTYNTCSNVACGYNSCSNSACGNKTCQTSACGTTYSCSSGWTLSGTQCTKASSTRTLYRWYYRSCTCRCGYRVLTYSGGYCTGYSTSYNNISNGTYYNTPSCDSACEQKNSGTVTCHYSSGYTNSWAKHNFVDSGSCTKVYTAWQTSSTKPSSSYNDSWKETKTETYCPSGTLSGSTCILNATATINTCANAACGYLSCAIAACGNKTCANAACGCQTYKSCATAECGNKSCANAACGCQTYNRCESCPCEVYNQTYSPCSSGENTCEGGMENKCIASSDDKYNSGNGGTSSIDTSALSNSSYIHGNQTGNGKIVVKYLRSE